MDDDTLLGGIIIVFLVLFLVLACLPAWNTSRADCVCGTLVALVLIWVVFVQVDYFKTSKKKKRGIKYSEN